MTKRTAVRRSTIVGIAQPIITIIINNLLLLGMCEILKQFIGSR